MAIAEPSLMAMAAPTLQLLGACPVFPPSSHLQTQQNEAKPNPPINRITRIERDRERERTLMAEMVEKDGGGTAAEEEEGEEEKRLLEGVAVLDFDVLCSTVAMQTQGGKWTKLGTHDGDFEDGGAEFGGVFRMWEGELLDCFQDRRIALQSACCPSYRFGKNMGRAGFGSCIVQGIVHFILGVSALVNCIAFIMTKRNFFLYLAVAFTISVGAYLGFFRSQIRKKFNIRGTDSSMDDCVYHLICPCCTLCQESRTLEMNNVQEGTWHGRSDTICIGGFGEGSKALFELHPPPIMSTKSPDPCNSQKSMNPGNPSLALEIGHSAPLVAQSQ